MAAPEKCKDCLAIEMVAAGKFVIYHLSFVI